MKKQVIAVDIDDVLADNAAGFAAFSNERWGTELTAGHYQEHWATVWQTDAAETDRRALEFLQSGVLGTYNHYAEAKPVLDYLSQHFDLVVVTSRRSFLKPETDAWLEKFFPGVFLAVHYAGMWDAPSADRHLATKTEILSAIGADYLIDDQLKHCLSAAGAGVKALLFGEYTWNTSDEALPQGVDRVKDWSAILVYFQLLLKEGAD